jgi:hypothetical protein
MHLPLIKVKPASHTSQRSEPSNLHLLQPFTKQARQISRLVSGIGSFGFVAMQASLVAGTQAKLQSMPSLVTSA